MLLRLQNTNAATLLDDFKAGTPKGGANTQQVFAALSLLISALPDSSADILEFISLHQHHVNLSFLRWMYENTDPKLKLNEVVLQECSTSLQTGGLIELLQRNIYTLLLL